MSSPPAACGPQRSEEGRGLALSSSLANTTATSTSPRLPKLPSSAERCGEKRQQQQQTKALRRHEHRREEPDEQPRHPLTLAVVQQLRAQLDMRYPSSTTGLVATRSTASGNAAGSAENLRISSGHSGTSQASAQVGIFRGAVDRQRTARANTQQPTTEAFVRFNRDCDAVLPGETTAGGLNVSNATLASIPMTTSMMFPLTKDTEMLRDRGAGRNLTAEVFRGLLQPFAHSNARGESDGVAQTLDHMIEQLLRDDPYYAAMFSKRVAGTDGSVISPVGPSTAVGVNDEGAMRGSARGASRGANRARGNHSPRRVTAGDPILPLPPAKVDEAFRCSDAMDSVSLVQAHLQRAQPLKVDFERFLSSQQRLANILSLGWGEVIRQIRSQSTERAAVLSTLRSAFEAVLDNAHDAAWYYKCVYDDVVQLRVDETIKDLSNQLAAKVDECRCLAEKVHRLEVSVEAAETLKKELQRMQAKQDLTDKFLKDQLVRNAAIMKMATQATGGVIPSHVIAAMMGVASAGGGGPHPPARGGQRRSTRQRLSVASGGFGSLSNIPGEAPDIEVQRSASLFESNPQSPQKAFSPPPFFAQQAGFGGADAAGFSVGDDAASVDGEESVDAPFSSYDLVDANTQTTIDDTINAQLMNEFQNFYVELDRAANYSQSVCRIVYGSTDFYNPTECCENARKLLEEISLRAIQERELHIHAAAAAGGGTTAAATPAPLEASSSGRPQAGAGSAATPGGRHVSGANSSSSTSLVGFFDVSKERTLRLLGYGIAAAKEMRLRFGALAENDSFRRAVEWKAPRGPKEPCRCCGRTTLSSEELAVMQEVTELRDKVKSLEADVTGCYAEIEKLGKRVEFEKQISQTRAEELDAMHRIRRSMLPEYSQTEATTMQQSAVQTDLAVPVTARMNLAAIMHAAASSSTASSGGLPIPLPPTMSGLPSGESSSTVTPFYGSGAGGAPAVMMGTPHNGMLELDGSLLHNADAEWSQFGSGAGGGSAGGNGGGAVSGAAGDRLGVGAAMGSGIDATFVTRSAAVGGSARRRSSIEVTFHDDGRSSGEPIWSDSPSIQGGVVARQLSAERRTSRQFLSTPRSGSGSETSATPTRRDVSPNATVDLAVPPHHSSNPSSEYSTARRGSELTASALRYRDTFLSLGRAGRTPPQDRNLGERRESSLLSSSGGLHRSGSALARSASELSGSGSVRSLNWAIRMMGSVYRSRFAAGQSERAVSPDAAFSCSKHFADFLRQNFGTKVLVEENANAFLRAVHVYRKSDARFALFARLFEDEFHKGVYRAFLTFSALLDQTLPQYDAHASAKKGDELAEPSTVPLEHVLNAIYTLFYQNDKYAMREELCHLLALRCVELSTLAKNSTPTTTATQVRRKASLVAVKAFDVPGTPIESSDAFSKYRDAFKVLIPSDAVSRVVLRIAVLTFFCEVARPYVVKASNLSPISSNSRSNSALPETVL